MSLFLDGNISTIEDLRAYDSSILTVSNVEQIDLTAKLRLAERELQVELQRLLVQNCARQVTPATVDLSAVVVTEPLTQWHCLRTLALVYRDAYYSQINDRYQGRWQEYVKLDAHMAGALANNGVGMVADPVQRPGAPTVTVEAGANPPATYYLRVSWLNATGQEGQGSATSAVIADQFHTLTIAPPEAPANATGWNLYLGYSDSAMTRQNESPLELDANWILPGTVSTDGPPPTEGQAPEYFLTPSRVMPRG